MRFALTVLAATILLPILPVPPVYAQEARPLDAIRTDVEAAARSYSQDRLKELTEELETHADVDTDLETNRLRLRAVFYEANLLRYRRKIEEHDDASTFKARQVEIAERGEEIVATLVEAHPDDVGLRILLGEFIALQITGPNGALIGPKAADQIDKAIELDPTDPAAHLAAGRRYLWTPGAFGGSDTKALEHLQQAEKVLNERERARIKARRAQATEGITDPAEKKRVLRQLVGDTRREVWRLHEEVLIQLAVAYRKVGRDSRARVALKRALATNADSEAAKLLLARLDAEQREER